MNSTSTPKPSSIDANTGKVSFVDNFKQKCSIQKSNSLLSEIVLLGIDKDILGQPINARMHLTRQQVKMLLPYLQHFAETGDML